MKTFEIRLIQELKGYYEGTIKIDAKNKTEALKVLSKMSNEEIDKEADWAHGDEYNGDITTISVDKTNIEEI